MSLLAKLCKTIWHRPPGPGGRTEEVCPTASVSSRHTKTLYLYTKENLIILNVANIYVNVLLSL